jgi:ribonuclease D
MTLHCQLDKKQQCANWSKRPLTQLLKDYAAMDVIVMIDIYDRLKTKIGPDQEWFVYLFN